MVPAKSVQCRTCGHRQRSVFRALEDEALRRLDGQKAVQAYTKGQQIFQEGGPPLAIHCVHTGHVRLSKGVRPADDVVVRVAGPGDALGLSAVIAGEPHDVTAEAIEDAAICTIAKETVDELMQSCPSLAGEMLTTMAHELRASQETVVEFAHRRARQRLVHLLLELLPRGHAEDPVTDADHGTIRLRVMRTEMARMIGSTPETVSRLLHRLERRGIVRLTRTCVDVVDVEALRGMAANRTS